MNCKKSMATFLALAIAANSTGLPVRAEGKSFLERIEALEKANWTMTSWRNALNNLGDLPEDIDELDEFLLQDQYFNGNLTLAEKIFNAPKRHVAKNEGYNETLLAQEFNGYEANVCMSDEVVHDYQQQVAELLEGSWLDLVNGTDLMLHMKDGRVFDCADLLPDGLCRDLIRTFTKEGREAAEKELRAGLAALGVTVVMLFIWKVSFGRGVANSNKQGAPKPGPGSGSGGGKGAPPINQRMRLVNKKSQLHNRCKGLAAGQEKEDLLARIKDVDVVHGDIANVEQTLKELERQVNELEKRQKQEKKKDEVKEEQKIEKKEEVKKEPKVEQQEEKKEEVNEEPKEEQNPNEEAERVAQEALLAKKGELNKTAGEIQELIESLDDQHKGSLQNKLNALKQTITSAQTEDELNGVEDQLNELKTNVQQAMKDQIKAEEERKKQEEQAQQLAKAECKKKIDELQKLIEEARKLGVDVKMAESTLEVAKTVESGNNTAPIIKGQTNSLDIAIRTLKNQIASAKQQLKLKQERESREPEQQEAAKAELERKPKALPAEVKEEPKQDKPQPQQQQQQQQAEGEQIEPVAQMVNVEPEITEEQLKLALVRATQAIQSVQAVQNVVDAEGRVKAAQAALQAAQAEPQNAELIEKKCELVDKLIEEQLQANKILGIGENDEIVQDLKYIQDVLEELELNAFRELLEEKKKVAEANFTKAKEKFANVENGSVLEKAEALKHLALCEAEVARLSDKNQKVCSVLQRAINDIDDIIKAGVDAPTKQQLEEMKLELEKVWNKKWKQLMEDASSENSHDDSDNEDEDKGKGGQGGSHGGQGNGMQEKKEQKDDNKDGNDSDQHNQQNTDQNSQGGNENAEKKNSRVDLAYLANVAKHIPECLFTKENLGAAAGVGVAAATSGIPAAIPAAGAAAIGYNTLKCAQNKANAQRPVLKLKSWETKQREAYAEAMEELQFRRDKEAHVLGDEFLRRHDIELY